MGAMADSTQPFEGRIGGMGEVDSLIAVMGLILTSVNPLNIRIDNNAKELRDIVGANGREVNGRIDAANSRIDQMYESSQMP